MLEYLARVFAVQPEIESKLSFREQDLDNWHCRIHHTYSGGMDLMMKLYAEKALTHRKMKLKKPISRGHLKTRRKLQQWSAGESCFKVVE